MTIQKQDRRKQYTRMVLKDSLMHLLQKKQISKLTVKEICEIADINRSTFYDHYKDLFDLREQIEDELIEDLNMYLSAYNYEKEAEAILMTEKLMEYFVSKREECLTLLNENSDSSFEKKAGAVARQYIMKSWMDVVPVDAAISEYVSTFIISGSIQVMKVWLQNDMDKSPQEMAQIIFNLGNKSILDLK